MEYDLAAIHRLINNAFTAKGLWRFCQTRSDFHPVLNLFSAERRLADMTSVLVEYCEKQMLFSELLSEIEEYNPRQYDEYCKQVGLDETKGTEKTERLARKKLSLEPIPSVPHFVGREEVLAAYRKKLQQEHLVIIMGMAGVGKTTLGAKLARMEAEREEQIFWFTFDPIDKNTAEALFWALAAFLDSQGKPALWKHLEVEIDAQRPPDPDRKLNLLVSSLSGGEYVLCFDDFHIVKDVLEVLHFFRLIQKRFRGRPQDLPARLVIMGREISARMQYLVAEPLAGFTDKEAGAFVRDRNLSLPADLVQQLWERTEGNPKLLELSVSALTDMGANQAAMEHLLGRRGDVRDYLMHEVFNTLRPEEQQVAGILSIFPAPVSQEALEDVLYAEGVTGVSSHLDALMYKSIVGETDDLRIHSHGLVREYYYRQLDRKDRERYHQRAAEYYDRRENYLAAAYHYFQQGAQDQALDLLSAHSQAIIHGGEVEGLLEQLSRFQPRRLSAEQCVALATVKGEAHEMRGEYAQALSAFKAALEDARGDKARADLLREVGTAYHKLGDYRLALERFTESLAMSEALGDQEGKASAHHNLGWAYHRLGQLQEARDQFGTCRELASVLGDDLLLAKADLGLGSTERREGELEEARKRFEASRRTFRALGDRRRESFAVGNLGVVYLQMGDSDQGLACYLQALQIQEEMGDVYSLYTAYNNLGDLYHRLGDHAQMVRYYEQLAQLAQDTGHQPWLCAAYAGLADAHLALGNPQQALKPAQEAHRIGQELGSGIDLGVSCRVLGEVWLALGDLVQAKAVLEQCIPLLEEANEAEELAIARRGLERALSRLGDDPSCEECAKEDDQHE
jgi:tetratricopeptide (TPR) repeat protein